MVDKKVFRQRALALISKGERGVARHLADEFGVSRAAASKHLRALIDAGLVEAKGRARGRVLHLATLSLESRTYPREGLSEDVVWREVFAPVVAGLPENVRDIWRYGVTEMVNNAIDHSGSPEVHVMVQRDAMRTACFVIDRGEGIFLKIQRAFNLVDPREALLELAKGKLTTDPVNHTGEGVFFASKTFDSFLIISGGLMFVHGHDPSGMLLGEPKADSGTVVYLQLANGSPRLLKAVFDEFAGPEEYTFAKTIVPVRLAQYEGEKLVSRSQAKRLCMRFERFQRVVLDFAEVTEIGQAFADEVFRVSARAHPGVALTPINTTPEVDRMIRRALAAAQ